MNRVCVLCFCLVVISAAAPPAHGRDCTSQERADGNAQLAAIASDEGRRMSILSRHLPFGVHRSTPDQNGQLLFQNGYMLSHDPDLRTTVWVSYRLDGDDIANAQGQERVNCFRRDPRLDSDDAATPADYDEPIFDQGHMANDADLKDLLLEQVNTYVMSNMSPQHCRFNRGIWLSLEHLTRIWADNEQYGALLVTSGAIFDRDDMIGRDPDDAAIRMRSRSNRERVAVPSHYYKVIMRQEESGWKSIAFLLPHSNEDHGVSWDDVRPDVIASIVSISEIGELASLRLHPALNRGELTETILGSDWDFSEGRSNFNSSIQDDSNCVTAVP